MTRAFLALVTGEFKKAFYFHPLVFLFLVGVISIGLVPTWVNEKWFSLSTKKRTFYGVVIVALVLGTWLVRLFLDLIP